MELDQMRQLFPVTRRYAYLNHAAVGPLPQPVVKSVNRYVTDRGLTGSLALGDFDSRIEGVRLAAAEFIGASPDEISFTSSVSHGLNIVAAGLDWRPGDNVVCAETEFPANIYPWMNLQRRGVEVRLTRARENRILVKDVAELIDHRTRLVAISLVEFGTGYRNRIRAIAELCHRQEAFLCVDGIQGLGALQFDVVKEQVDFLATQAAKWMLGPVGAGFLYVRRELLSCLDPVMAGWRSVQHPDEYYRFDSPLCDSGRRLEPGSLNFVGLVGLQAAIDLLQSVGLVHIEERIMALTDHLIAGFRSRGCTIASPVAERRERSGIVCFRHPDVDTHELAQRLESAGVIVCQRGEVIRVSPHFYNNQDDIDRLFAALPA